MDTIDAIFTIFKDHGLTGGSTTLNKDSDTLRLHLGDAIEILVQNSVAPEFDIRIQDVHEYRSFGNSSSARKFTEKFANELATLKDTDILVKRVSMFGINFGAWHIADPRFTSLKCGKVTSTLPGRIRHIHIKE